MVCIHGKKLGCLPDEWVRNIGTQKKQSVLPKKAPCLDHHAPACHVAYCTTTHHAAINAKQKEKHKDNATGIKATMTTTIVRQPSRCETTQRSAGYVAKVQDQMTNGQQTM
jgi:hypothetical protein